MYLFFVNFAVFGCFQACSICSFYYSPLHGVFVASIPHIVSGHVTFNFPNKMKEQESLKRKLNARIEYAKFLQETAKEMAKEVKDSRSGEVKHTAEALDEFLNKDQHRSCYIWWEKIHSVNHHVAKLKINEHELRFAMLKYNRNRSRIQSSVDVVENGAGHWNGELELY